MHEAKAHDPGKVAGTLPVPWEGTGIAPYAGQAIMNAAMTHVPGGRFVFGSCHHTSHHHLSSSGWEPTRYPYCSQTTTHIQTGGSQRGIQCWSVVTWNPTWEPHCGVMTSRTYGRVQSTTTAGVQSWVPVQSALNIIPSFRRETLPVIRTPRMEPLGREPSDSITHQSPCRTVFRIGS